MRYPSLKNSPLLSLCRGVKDMLGGNESEMGDGGPSIEIFTPSF
jgi:hypothetical protein